MLTVGEQNAIRELKQAAQTFNKAVEKLIRLSAMNHSETKYTEEDYIKLLTDDK